MKKLLNRVPRRFRSWLTGVVAAAVAALLVGILTDAPKRVYRAIRSEPRGPIVSVAPATLARIDRWSNDLSKPDLYFYWRWTPRLLEGRSLPTSVKTETTFAAWEAKNSTEDAQTTWLELVVAGRSSHATVLTGVGVTVSRRGKPPHGSAYLSALGFPTGDVTGTCFGISLDTGRPRRMSGACRRSARFPISVTDADPAAVSLFVSTSRCDCEWKAKLYWVDNGHNGSSIIDDHGKPFRTVAILNSQIYKLKGRRFSKVADCRTGSLAAPFRLGGFGLSTRADVAAVCHEVLP
jgi:hypothetical protein